ncbi:hypothetical protein KRX54_00100 [Actinomycetaceae bacterium TAE3-ERU4]|nr:hypothetical protein [Actinomycetaceae bacterium TAE3-ERU4]
MLASLAVDMANHYRQTHGREQEILKSLEARRKDIESNFGNFVKAIAVGIFNDTTAQAMKALEEQKKELEEAIQFHNVKAALFEDEANIGSFYEKYVHATMDITKTPDLLFEYFIDKVFVSDDTITIASWFFDHGNEITLENLDQAEKQGKCEPSQKSSTLPPSIKNAGLDCIQTST